MEVSPYVCVVSFRDYGDQGIGRSRIWNLLGWVWGLGVLRAEPGSFACIDLIDAANQTSSGFGVRLQIHWRLPGSCKIPWLSTVCRVYGYQRCIQYCSIFRCMHGVTAGLD